MRLVSLIVTILLLFILIGCEKDYDFIIENNNSGKIKVFGHGGMGFIHKYPVDTYEAIKNCLSVGADGCEIDVQMSKDGFMFAFHDETMDRSTNMSGRINEHYYKKVEMAQYDNLPNGEFMIVTLDEIFGHIKKPNSWGYSFDCKLYPATTDTIQYFNDYAENLLKIINSYDLKKVAYVESSSPTYIKIMNQKDSNVNLFFYAKSFKEAITIGPTLPIRGITIASSAISAEQIKELHALHYLVAIFGAYTESQNVRLVRKNPDIIQTDDVRNLVRILR